MGVIKEYGDAKVSRTGAIQQREYTPDMLGAAEGRALMQMGEAVQDVGNVVAKRLDQENTSDVTAKLTKANADLAIKLQQTLRTAEPGDKKVFEDYQKEVDDTLGKIGEGASTLSARQFYSEASVRIKGQLSQTAANGQADLAGVKAVADYKNTANAISTTVMADPTSVGLQMEIHRQSIENLVKTGQLPRDKAIQLQSTGETDIAVSTMRGWIELNPEHARGKLKSGEFDQYLGADKKAALLGEIEQAKRAKEIDAERVERLQEKALKKAQTQTQNDFLMSMAEGNLSADDIRKSNLDPTGGGSKVQFLEMLAKMNDPEQKLKPDGGTIKSLYERIHLPDGDPNKLVDENELNKYFGNGLDFANLNRLRDEMQGSQTEAGKIESEMKKQVMEIAKGKLTRSNPLTGLRDPVGDEQMAKFMGFFLDEYKTQRQKGASAMELLNPESPKYLGKSINQYTRTNQQIMRDLVPRRAPPSNGLATSPLAPAVQGADASAPAKRYEAPKTEPLKRLPGESAPAFLARKKAAGGG